MVPLKYLCSFWRTLEVILKWSRKCIRVAGTANNQNPSIQVNDIKLYAPAVFLSTQKKLSSLKNQNLVLKEQLVGKNIQPKQQIEHETDIQVI